MVGEGPIPLQDCRKADFIDDLLTSKGCVHSRERGRAKLEPASVIAVLEAPEVEVELVLGGKPGREPGLERFDQRGTYVEVGKPRSAE